MNAADYDAAETTKIVVPYNKLTIEPQVIYLLLFSSF